MKNSNFLNRAAGAYSRAACVLILNFTFSILNSVPAQAGSLKFNGTTSSVLVENSVTGLRFPGTNPFTIEAWVKVNSLSSFQTILSKWNGNVAGEYYLGINTNGTLLFHREVAPNFDFNSSNAIPVGVWTHVTVTYTNGTRRFYLNGQLDPAIDPGSGAIPAGPTTVLLGARFISNLPTSSLNGDLDEVRIWSTNRSAAEIQQNMHHRLDGTEANLVAYYPADEVIGSRVLDFSGRSFTGLLQGGAVVNQSADATQPVAIARDASGVTTNAAMFTAWADGSGLPTTNHFEYGPGSTALRFDGVNDYVSVPGGGIPASGDFTVEVWARLPVAPNSYREIVSQGAAGNAFYIGVDPANNVRPGISWGSVPYPVGGWHHLAVAKTSTNTFFYLDGVRVATQGSAIPNPSATELRIGRQHSTGAEYWPGEVDEVRVWSGVALDAATIQDWVFKEVDNTHPDFAALNGYWKLNEGAGTVATDSSGQGRHGTLLNGPIRQEGVRPTLTQITPPFAVTGTNAALDLNGISAYVDVPDAVWFNGNFTIELKAFIRAYSNWGRFLDFANGQGVDEVIFSQEGSGRLALYMVNGNFATVTAAYSTNQLPLNQWLNLAVTVQGTTATLYMNGAVIGSGTIAAPVGVVRTLNWIGRPHWPGETYGNQILDDVRIWNVARTASELRDGMTEATDPTHPNLLLNYRFNGDTGNVARDSRTVFPRDGQLLGGAAIAANTNLTLLPQVSAPVNGLAVGTRHHFRNSAMNTNGATTGLIQNFATLNPGRGTALDFDGQDDQVTGVVPQLPTGNSSYTIEAWIKPRVMGDDGIVGWGNYTVLNQVNALRLYPNGIHHYWWNNDLSAPVGDLTDGWHHVAASYDGTVRKIYVDGVVRAAANATGHNVTTTANFAIGKTYGTEFFDGQIDEVRIWNVSRTDGEVAQYMNERLSGTENGLVLYNRLDDGGGSIAHDATANAIGLGLIGAPEWAGSQAGVAIPLATTLAASEIGFGSAKLNGTVNTENSMPSRYWFEYGAGGSFNLVTPELSLPAGVAVVSVNGIVANLGISPSYNYRLVAANDNGTNRGATQEFIMSVPGAQTALQFDGVNDQIVVGNSTAYKATTNLTVEAWIYPTGSSTDGIIVNKEGEYEFARFGDGTLRWAIANTFPGWLWINTGVVAPLNRWLHVAFTYDGSFVRLYTNGVQASAGTATGVIGDIEPTLNDLRVGGRQGASQFFQGAIDDVRVWLVARSPAQIAASFNRKLIPPQPGLAAYLRFDEGIGTTTANLANSTTSTLFGGPGPLWIHSGAGIIDPIVTTLTPTPVLATSAMLRGSINPSGESVTTYFEYGQTVAYGSTTVAANYPASLATLPLSAGLTGLEPGTTYHYRLVGYNPAQTNYGANQTFTTLVLGSGWPVSTKLTGGEAHSPLHVLDGLGNTYVAGVFSGSASFKSPITPTGGATANAFVGKMSRTADWLWAINIPASANGFSVIKAIGTDANRNVYVAGQFSGTNTFVGATNLVSNNDTNLFVAKLDSSGTNWLWARGVGGVGVDSANALTVTGTNLFVAGSFSGPATFGATTLTNAGGTDVFVAALDQDGNWLWANRGGGTGGETANTLATDSINNVFVAGQYSGTATFGTTPLTNAGGTDLFVGKLTPAGVWLDIRRGGGVNNDTAAALTRSAANEMYLAGQFGGTADYGGTLNNVNTGNSTNFFVLRLNSDATYADYFQGGPGNARSITVDSLNRIYVAGDFTFATSFGTNSLISSGNSDVFLAQLVGGVWTWAQKIGSAGTETGGSISADTDNSVVISGMYQGTIQIGYVALSSPNNRDIFIARLGVDRVYEHNNYTVGQPIPVPIDAQDQPNYGDGAIGQPIITILEKDQPDSDALNSFVWSIAEHKLFPVRQVTAILKWPLTTNPTNTTAVVTAVGRIAFPTNPVIHVANAPAELEPAVANFPLKFLNLSFTTINGASVDASTKIFTAPAPGWSVVQFLDSEGELPDPLIHPSKFEVVRTVNWNDAAHLLDNQSADIGAALAFPAHVDPTGKNGYVYFQNAFYDGAGDERAHDRASRTGPIIPVNKDTASATDDLVVVWYQLSGNGIAWPGKPVRYVADWPTNAAELVLASRLGSGPLSLLEFPSKRVYRQPDQNLPGFNPNEEHAALYDDTLYALRNDLNEVVSPKASEPYTLLKYIDPGSGQWAMRVFKVVTTNATFPLIYNGVAGQPLLLPEPLSFLNLCNLSNRYVSGPGFQDHLGRLYARGAGPGVSGTNIVTRYWYPLQPGFDGMTNFAVGTCVPWLDRRPGGVAGTPVDITYNITWPVGVPTLQIGETLLNAKFGLPAVRNFASADVIYDQGNPDATNALDSFVRLFDPLSARTLQLATNFVLPATIASANDAGKLVFTDLPYSLRSRLRYDDLNKQLSFSGLLDESVAYGGPDNPLLLLNVLSPRERDRIKQLSTAPAFLQAIDDLYQLTRNPNRIDRNGDNLADQELLIGLTAPNLNTNLNLRTGPLQPEKLGDIPKALTAGPGTGTGFVTVVENNDPSLGGLPVTLHVIQIADGPFRGDIKVLYPDNVFDEKLTLRHSADFGGEPQRFEFEWYYMPDDPGLDHTILPTVDAEGDITSLNNWTPYPSIPPGTNGFNDITIGDGSVGGLLTLADNWFLCRYRGYSINGETNWTDWVGVIGGGGPQLAEGWVKRVVFGLNPFEARTDEFHANETVTFASMLQQAGARYEGDIAFNPSGANLNSVGLISAYQTVLNRAKKLSVDAAPGINYPPANNALLLAASRLSDFYMLLGNEAYADAADPTIGFRTDNAGYGTLAPSIFTFQNQLDSLLEEELVLLRGRDDRSATVRSAPAYNRLFWNFTHDEGEVAYAQAYNITDQNGDGFITADDGRILYPQGHGDAWGHYLTATTSYYTLLQNTNFDWIPRSESILLAGVPVEVDYLDERKFARAAAAKAKTGAELVGLTYRINYVDDPAGQYQGYKDTDASRAWGLSEWAHRAGSAAVFDWVIANAVLPATDPNTNHVGIEKIDRTTVTEVDEIVVGFENVQNQMDKADSGLNPLGLAKNVVPFDIDPSLIAAGKTHFEQIYDRAIEAMKNSVTVFNHANQLSQALRSLQDSVNDFTQNADQQERDYKNRMIEAFGYPYAGDIGPGKTYPSGYDGPDLYHYMYVGTIELNGDTAPPSQTFTAFFKPKLGLNTVRPQGLLPTVEVDFHGIKASFGEPDFYFPADAPGNPGDRLTNQVLAVSFPYSASDYGFTAPTAWGSRRAPGEIQLALSEFVQSQARFKQAQLNYDNLLQQIEAQIELLQVRYDVQAEQVEIQNHEFVKKLNLKAKAEAAKRIAQGLHWASTKLNQSTDVAVEALPKSVGLATDATSGFRSVLKALKYVATSVLDLGAQGAELAEHSFTEAKKELPFETALEIQSAGFPYEVQQQFNVLEELIRQEIVLRVEAFSQREVLTQSLGRYEAAVARGLRLLEERTAFRKNAAADTQASRYQDMTFRIFRNDAIQKYRAQFDLAAQYVFLAAVAYDFETQLLGDRPGAGRAFLTDIIRQRALGEVVNGVPVAGRHGLADPLARLNQNFGVLKGQLGFNNPQTETGRFSLRNELFRQRDTSDEQWRAELKKSVVPDLWQIPEFRRYCRPFAPESAGPQPGLVIRFPTTVTFGLNYFGWPLGGGDSAYDSTLFATKVRSAGVWFENYLGSGLSQTPRVYLVPVGADVMRSPSGNNLETREWRVVDQKIPVPFPIGFSSLNSSTWIPVNDSLSDTFADIRRFSSFRAYHDSGVFNPAETITDSRLIGRSVWNSDWMLIIPGGTFLFDPNQGLDTFINSVGDIKIFFQTYAYSGN